jgi:hypothetical protein
LENDYERQHCRQDIGIRTKPTTNVTLACTSTNVLNPKSLPPMNWPGVVLVITISKARASDSR